MILIVMTWIRFTLIYKDVKHCLDTLSVLRWRLYGIIVEITLATLSVSRLALISSSVRDS